MLELKNISKIIDNRVILNDISIRFPKNGFVGIKGKSGNGKSSLLYILSMLDEDFLGSLFFNGKTIDDVDEYRKNHISYMMQSNDYIDALTIKENIVLSCRSADIGYLDKSLNDVTKRLGIDNLLNRYPSSLSGGQLKRMCIAKALLKDADILICDEPTGALFQSQSHEIMQLLKEVSKDKLVIIVSHDEKLLDQYCDSVLTLENGKLLGETSDVSDDSCIIPKKKKGNLLFYVTKQMLKQKYKYCFFVLFQWFLIGVFLLVLSGVLGVFSTIKESENSDIYKNVIVIENKDGSRFEEVIKGYKYADYSYNLEYLDYRISDKDRYDFLFYFLPYDTSHIKLIKGSLPKSKNEVVVSENLYNQIKGDKIIVSCDGYEYELEVCGAVKGNAFKENKVYLSNLLKEELSFLKDEYSLTLESGEVKNDYKKLQKDYYAYCETIDRIENYSTIISYAKIMAFVCVVMSLAVSLLLYSIVSSIVLEERVHDLCYLKTLGLTYKRIYHLTFVENIILAIIISIGGILFYELCLYYFNHVFDIYSVFYFQLKRCVIYFGYLDIYVVIFIVYIGLCALCNAKAFKYIKELNVIEVLREE